MYPPIFLSDPGLPLLPDSLTHRPWLSPTDRAATGLEEEGGRRAQSCSAPCCMRHATDWPAASLERGWEGGRWGGHSCWRAVVSPGLSGVFYCLKLDKCCWQQTLKESVMLVSCRVLGICPDSPGFELVPVIQSEKRDSGVQTESWATERASERAWRSHNVSLQRF